MDNTVTIKVGEQGTEYFKRNPTLIKTWQSLPGVVQDYSIDWDVRNRGSVRLEHGKYSFVVEHVLSVLTSQDLKDLSNEGLNEFSLIAGLSNVSGIHHDEARLRTYDLLRKISAAGWKNLIDIGSPRLRGQERLSYLLQPGHGYVGLDVAFLPTFDEWMQIEDGTPWNFYADGLYMEISFRRSSEHMDPKDLGVYQLSINIKTDKEFFRGFAGPDKRDQWREVVPGELVKIAKMRANAEAELRAKGFQIDESYQDPPVPSFN